MFGSRIESVTPEKLNLDLECYFDFMQGRGVRLTSVESYDKKNEKIHNGLQSDFFGSDFGDDSAFEERYSCKCKKYIGKMYENIVCDVCDTPVQFNDADLTKTGWIVLDNYCVISPIYCAKLIDAFGSSSGEKVFNKMIDIIIPDDSGNAKELTEKELIEIKKHPFMNKGMIWLKENLWEVLDYYEKRKPTKAKLFKELKEDIANIFVSSIPVYTALLRTELPGVKGNKLYKLKVNTIYQSIIRIVNYINDFTEVNNNDLISINKQLASIQNELMDIFVEIYKELTGKKGLINSKVLGRILPVSSLIAGIS